MRSPSYSLLNFLFFSILGAVASSILSHFEFSGSMRGIAFAYDPDGYWVEIIQRGVKFLK